MPYTNGNYAHHESLFMETYKKIVKEQQEKGNKVYDRVLIATLDYKKE